MNKARYEWYKSQGICPQCKKTKVQNRVICEECQKKASERKRILIHRKREKGICIKCGKSVIDGSLYCVDCKKLNAKSIKEVRQIRKSMGYCVSCGKEKAIKGETLCLVCKMDKRSSNKDRVRKYDSDKEMSRYYDRKSKGICTSCGNKPKSVGLLCSSCYSKRVIRKENNRDGIPRGERVSFGLCYICGKEALDGKGVCSECYATRLKAISGIMYMDKEDKNANYWDNINTLDFEKRDKNIL